MIPQGIDHLIQKNGKFRTEMIRAFKILYLLLSTGLFLGFYFLVLHQCGFYCHFLHLKPHLLFPFCYAALLLLLVRVYNGFYFGATQTSGIAFSLTLATTLANGVMYILICLYLNQLLSLGYPFLMFFGNLLINLSCANLGNRLYFRLNPPKESVMIYGTQNDLIRMKEVSRFTRHFNITKYIEAPTSAEELLPQLKPFEVIFVSGISPELRNSVAEYCLQNNIISYIDPRLGDFIISGSQYVSTFGIPIAKVSRISLTPEFRILKRFFDILISLLAIILFSPLMLLAAFLIKSDDHGPVFYKQVRLTQYGREFEILKFRSMRIDAEKDGVARLASKHDDRITPVGHFLRACRMDELPQLFNVLKGDMSLVGPRPERPEITRQYRQQIPSFDLRLQVKAGITGFAQVYGKYNTEPYDKLQMDLMYINHLSLVQDLWLILATLKVLFETDSTNGVDAAQVTAIKKGDGRLTLYSTESPCEQSTVQHK